MEAKQELSLNLESNNNPLSIFNFANKNIRFKLINDIYFLCGKDVCEVLDISWKGNDTLQNIPTEWKIFVTTELEKSHNVKARKTQTMIFLNQQAVMKLAFRSNKPDTNIIYNGVIKKNDYR